MFLETLHTLSATRKMIEIHMINPHFVIYGTTYLPIVLNVDCAVIHFHQEEVL